MKINDEEFAYIERNLTFHGISSGELKEDLLDHIASSIEHTENGSFEDAYQIAIQKLGGYGALQLMQNQINEKAFIRKFLMRKRSYYMFSCLNMMILCLGFLFKMNKWPYANILMAIGFGMLIFCTIPFWFYYRYRLDKQKAILLNK